MRYVSEEQLELRGVEKRTGQNGEYHLFNFEDVNTGAPVQYYTKNLTLYSEVKRGEKYYTVIDYKERGKFKNFALVGVKNGAK